MVAVIRRRATEDGTNRYGETNYKPTDVALTPATAFAPGGSVEVREPGREAVITEPTLYWARKWPDVIASDQLIVNGTVYDVTGKPQDWRGGMAGGLVVTLREATEAAA